MKKFISLLFFILIFILTNCKSDKKEIKTDAAFGKYVQAFTSGTISKEAVISVYLAQPVSGSGSSEEKLFSFKPAISGKTVIVGNRIVEFHPEVPLKPIPNIKLNSIWANF